MGDQGLSCPPLTLNSHKEEGIMFKRRNPAPAKPDTSHLDEMDSWGPEMFDYEDENPVTVVHTDDHTYVLGCGKRNCSVDHWS